MTGLIGGGGLYRCVYVQTGAGTSVFSGPPLDALLCGGSVERYDAWLQHGIGVTTTIW